MLNGLADFIFGSRTHAGEESVGEIKELNHSATVENTKEIQEEEWILISDKGIKLSIYESEVQLHGR